MDLKRFSIILLVFAVVLMLLSWYVNRNAADKQKAEKDADKQADTRKAAPAPKPASAPASAPATAPTPRKAPVPPAATQAAATRPAPATVPATQPATQPTTQPTTQPQAARWFDDVERRALPPVVMGSQDASTDYLFEVTLTNVDAAIQTVRLSRHFATVEDKQLAAKHKGNYKAYEEARSQDPDKYPGQYSLLNPVEYKDEKHLPLATRDIRVKMAGASEAKYYRYWRLLENKPTDKGHQVSFERVYYYAATGQPAKPVLRVVKTYEIQKALPREKGQDDPLGYTILVSIRLENLSDKTVEVELDQAGPTGVQRVSVRGDQRAGAYGKLDTEDDEVDVSVDAIKEFSERTAVGESHDVDEPCLWVGQVNQYFGAMLYLVSEDEGKLQAADYEAEFYIEPIDESDDAKTHLTGIRIPKIELPAKADKVVRFELFAGPKRRDMFTDEDAENFRQRYKALNYLDTIKLAACWCTFDWLTLVMMWLLQKFWLLVHNYGLAIFMLVILVRVLLHPLTRKSQLSMVKMQKLAPVMQKLKEKYADDKETLNKEMMKLYKEQGAVPILGCLPMVLQMPILIALYTALQASVELRHSAFLPRWIVDLAAPDKALSWGGSIWLITWLTDNNLNLLPILLTVAMFLQMKFNPQMSGAAATPDQARQQSLMRWMMPTMMLFIFYKMPSGLNLYFMASTFLSVGEQWLIRRHIQAREASEAAATTTVTIPGKAARSKRPKKPKGPFWVKRG